jgi:hypothetical protein
VTTKNAPDGSLWSVVLRCSFFKGEIKSAKILSGCGNKKFDEQAVKEMLGRHVPEVSLGSKRHEYWRTLTWTMPKGAPYAEPNLPPKLSEPNVLVGVPFEIVTGMSASSSTSIQ